MSDRTRRILAVLLILAVTALIFTYFILVGSYDGSATLNDTDPAAEWPLVIGSYVSMLIGAFLVWARPRNPLGFLLMLSVGFATYTPLVVVVDWMAADFGPAFGVRLLAWIGNWAWVLTFAGIIYMMLLFPDGKTLTRRWGWLGRAAGVVLAVMLLATMFVPGPLEAAPEMDNPLGIGVLSSVPQAVIDSLALVVLALIAAAVVSLFLRFRRSSGVERLQLKWVAYAAVVTISLVVFVSFVPSVPGARFVDGLTEVLVPVAIAIAVLRYRLFDIDVVINKTLVFGSLAVLITVVYVGIVVGVGAMVGGGEEPSLLLSIVATSVVAVGFQPARRRLQRIANRVVFGERATPYEVLAGFSHQATSGGDVFGEVARLLVDGTAAEWVVITREGSGVPLVVWPEETMVDDGNGVHRIITHEDQVMGELRFGVAAGESLTSQQSEVVDHLVTALGLLLANTRLTAQLQDRVSDLESSRARIVAAGDEVRRNIETQLEEGPLATLTDISYRLSRLDVVSANGAKTPEIIGNVAGVVEAAKLAVVEFAQGVFPPVLEKLGLAGALQQRAETAPIPVTVEAELSRRYPLDVEAALYFTASEALQNTIKYANATRANIQITETNGTITLQVSDDGDGFDPDQVRKGAGTTNITERVTALDGQIQIESTPGRGTTITANIPVGAAR